MRSVALSTSCSGCAVCAGSNENTSASEMESPRRSEEDEDDEEDEEEEAVGTWSKIEVPSSSVMVASLGMAMPPAARRCDADAGDSCA